MDFSLPTPSFRKELQDLDDKWSIRMARLEALIMMGQRPSSQQPSFSPVKVPVTYQAPAGALSQTAFIQSSVPSGQAGPASGPDGTQTSAENTLPCLHLCKTYTQKLIRNRCFNNPAR